MFLVSCFSTDLQATYFTSLGTLQQPFITFKRFLLILLQLWHCIDQWVVVNDPTAGWGCGWFLCLSSCLWCLSAKDRASWTMWGTFSTDWTHSDPSSHPPPPPDPAPVQLQLLLCLDQDLHLLLLFVLLHLHLLILLLPDLQTSTLADWTYNLLPHLVEETITMKEEPICSAGRRVRIIFLGSKHMIGALAMEWE